MNCPKCGEEMEYEDIKNFSGYYSCGECDVEFPGSIIPCDSDGESITDYEENIYPEETL